jgi:hypothetical protein
MEALGRLINIIPTADGVFVNLKNASGVTFIGVKSGGDTYTVQSSTTATGGADLAVVTKWYENANADGSTVWTKHADQAAAAAVVSTAAVVAIEISANSLPDTHKYVKCTSTSTGLVYAIVHDLTVQRAPANLPALGV